jgi:hypothetical protein
VVRTACCCPFEQDFAGVSILAMSGAYLTNAALAYLNYRSVGALLVPGAC